MATAEPGSAAGGVYVHLPFCARICPYCDFAVTVGDRSARRRLVGAVTSEIERHAGGLPAPIDTIYFGGGTPSLIGVDDLARIVETLRRCLDVRTDLEIFLEANPEDVDGRAVEAWSRIGVTTLSLGVQSLDAAALAFLGRAHTPADAARAVETALAADFRTVSIDLIYARPGQRLADWRHELTAAAALGSDHLSCYQLTLASGTPFGRRAARGDLVEPPQRRQAELFMATHETLADLGYEGYEVSNFARSPRHRSRHNLKYWKRAPYLGFGPSAHSQVGAERWWNEARSGAYVERIEAGEPAVAGRESLSADEELLERVMLGLRTRVGLDLAGLEARFGVELWRPNRARLERWSEAGWVEIPRPGRLRPTPAGLAVADHLAATLELPSDRTAIQPERTAASANGRLAIQP